MERLLRHTGAIGTALVGLGAWLFFGLLYRHHLLYIEGAQLFLYTRDYLLDTLARPGGAADYAARFIVQFYHWPLAGAAGVALLLVCLRQGLASAARAMQAPARWTGLTFALPMAYWALMCDESFTLSGLVALTAAVWTARGYFGLRSLRARTLFCLLALPLLWLAAGGAALAALPMIALAECGSSGRGKAAPLAAMAAVSVVIVLLAPRIAPQIDPAGLLLGARSFRFLQAPLLCFALLWLAPAATLAAVRWLPGPKSAWMAPLVTLAVLGAGAYALSQRYMGLHEEVMAYLHDARRCDWERIVRRAERRAPASPLGTVALNLALAQRGESGDRLFAFRQGGTMGLLLPYSQDLLMGGEVLFHLGLVNEAQRYAYEGMESIPDQQKGAFYLTRLAETNLIAGRTKVAAKYLRTLQRTLCYRRWATGRLALCADAKALDAHPLYGRLRRLQPTERFTFDVGRFRAVLALLLEQHPDHALAYRYQLASDLLAKDPQAFSNHLVIDGRPLPRYYQEALVMLCHLQRVDPATLPLRIDQHYIRRLAQYVRRFETMRGNARTLAPDWGDTYWFYINFTPIG